jgi:hypothetical protein
VNKGEMDNDIKQFFLVGITFMLAMASLWIIFGLGDNQKIIDPIFLKIIKILAALFLGTLILIGIRKVLKK